MSLARLKQLGQDLRITLEQHLPHGLGRVWFTANGDYQLRCSGQDEARQTLAALRAHEMLHRLVRCCYAYGQGTQMVHLPVLKEAEHLLKEIGYDR